MKTHTWVLLLNPHPTCPIPHAAWSLEDTVLDDSVLEACQVLHYNVNEAGYQACEDSNEGTDNPALDLHCPESLDRDGEQGTKVSTASRNLLCTALVLVDSRAATTRSM